MLIVSVKVLLVENESAELQGKSGASVIGLTLDGFSPLVSFL